jgi:hypothetical protein
MQHQREQQCKIKLRSRSAPIGARQGGGAVATVNAFTKGGLFIGQHREFFELLADLANDADSANRGN